MENEDHSPEESNEQAVPAKEFIQILISYFVKQIKYPLKSGLAYFVAGLAAALVIGWVLFPMALYSKEEQPVKFSHAIHTNPDLVEGETEAERCAYCHSFRDDGSFTGIPTLSKCMDCHDDPESPLGESPEEKKFLEGYLAGQKEIPWRQYYTQPDCVYFSHIPHVKNGEIECKTCHGDHGSSESLPVYKKNRISGYSINIWGENISGHKTNIWDRMKMDDCAECHTKKGHEANNDCFVCHK
jgi:menaquinone reductase, multiheme cytochrome c subunit